MQAFLAAFPLLLLGIAAALVLLLAVAHKPGSDAGRSAPLLALGIGPLLAAAWALVALAPQGTFFQETLRIDGVAQIFGALSLVLVAAALLGLSRYAHSRAIPQGEIIAVALLSSCGLLLLACAGHVLLLFVGLEMVSLGGYILAGAQKNCLRSQEAAFKYFINGALASAFLLFGLALQFGAQGSQTGAFLHLPAAPSGPPTAVLGDANWLSWVALACIVAALAYKAALVPFHSWFADVLQGAPAPCGALLGVALKGSALLALYKLLPAFFATSYSQGLAALEVLAYLGMASMLGGSLLALRQRDLKRLLAYSGITQTGYTLVALAAGGHHTGIATPALLYQLLAYGAAALGVFVIVGALELGIPPSTPLEVDRLRGLGQGYPGYGALLSLFLLSLAGMPPTLGFLGKLQLLQFALQAGHLELSFVLLLASCLSAYVYIRLALLLWDGPAPNLALRAAPSAWRWALGALGASVALAALYSAPLLRVWRDLLL